MCFHRIKQTAPTLDNLQQRYAQESSLVAFAGYVTRFARWWRAPLSQLQEMAR